jgi:hypothetical protein
VKQAVDSGRVVFFLDTSALLTSSDMGRDEICFFEKTQTRTGHRRVADRALFRAKIRLVRF